MTTRTFRREHIRYSINGRPVTFRGSNRFEATSARLEDSSEPKFKFKKEMSYRRRRRNFKKPYGRKYYGRRPNAGRLALRKVNKLIRNQEIKIHTATNGSMTVLTGPEMRRLSVSGHFSRKVRITMTGLGTLWF